MPLQNRVTPTGDIIADPHRGLFTGNRGIIHDPAHQDAADASAGSSPAWLTCVCEFRGRRREVMGGRSWTELFFLDEAHRVRGRAPPVLLLPPRRRQPSSGGVGRAMASPDVLARDIDAVLHRERLDARRRSGCIARADGVGRIARRRDAAGGARRVI